MTRTDAPYGVDAYGNPYPFAVDAALLEDAELNDRSDADSGVSFSCLTDEDQLHVLWVVAEGRYTVQSPRSSGVQDWGGRDVHAAVAELKRRAGK